MVCGMPEYVVNAIDFISVSISQIRLLEVTGGQEKLLPLTASLLEATFPHSVSIWMHRLRQLAVSDADAPQRDQTLLAEFNQAVNTVPSKVWHFRLSPEFKYFNT